MTFYTVQYLPDAKQFGIVEYRPMFCQAEEKKLTWEDAKHILHWLNNHIKIIEKTIFVRNIKTKKKSKIDISGNNKQPLPKLKGCHIKRNKNGKISYQVQVKGVYLGTVHTQKKAKELVDKYNRQLFDKKYNEVITI